MKTAMDLAGATTRMTESATWGNSKRLKREWETVSAMIHCYCQGVHHSQALCETCEGLHEYARKRLQRCVFGNDKPVCAKCPVHCYQRAQRDKIKEVMRYAGPRMLWRHPWMSVRHWLDGLVESSPAK